MVVSFFPGRGTVFEEAYLDGEAEGKAKAVLRFLAARSLPVSDEVRDRVIACTDLTCLDNWLDRAVTVARAEDLFGEVPEAPQEKPDHLG